MNKNTKNSASEQDCAVASGPELAEQTLPLVDTGLETVALRLKRNEDRRLRAGHLWVYSNEVDIAVTPLKGLQPGQAVVIEASNGKAIGTGYVNPNQLICARIVSRDPKHPFSTSLLVHRLKVALALRKRLYPHPCYRLVYGEADGLPGVVIDRYDDVCVVQISTHGMEQQCDALVAALVKVLQPRAIVLRNDGAARKQEGLEELVELVHGDLPKQVLAIEGNARFAVDVMAGQKTGWFYDQRDNRIRAARYASERTVLDLFSYGGGFGIQAALAGASKVVCVDSSASALDRVEANAELNGVVDKIELVQGDAFEYLKAARNERESFDVAMVDPPAFIRRKKDRKAGLTAYRRINELAMRVLNRDAILATSSCSQSLSMNDLQTLLNASARHIDREIQVLEYGHQAADHPVHPAIPETAYLKQIIARIYR